MALAAAALFAQQPPQSPSAKASVTIGGKSITITYSAPSMRGRHIFNGPGALQPDNTIWRAGANFATRLITDADLEIGGKKLTKGAYTLYVDLHTGNWDLIVSSQNDEKLWGINRDGSTTLDPSKIVARVPMTMTKPAAPIETFKIILSDQGGNKGILTMEWENVIASVPFTVS